ncbi:nicotinate phosphoribosyltransferase [Benzoatithermus flavus]|uniref:Nicotinate phosphoribosyltransferase n=1 Tax=Benzoatithermus flavus TaxID=3108223 RepID=A0ABU8XQV5_9PROT
MSEAPALRQVDPAASLLLTDLYELNMYAAYLAEGMTATAVFDFFVRKLPPCRGFLLAAGLEQVVEFLEEARFSAAELDWLRGTGRFSDQVIEALAGFRFEGDLDAMPEGTVFFADEPILRVTAPLPQAQLLESRLINLLHFQTLIASKAARMVLTAPEKILLDFGLRRAHGAEAGLLAARAAYLAGFSGSATVLAEARFGVPAVGTMAHSFVQAHESEREAFLAFARARPAQVVLLLDTYDVEAAVRTAIEIAPVLAGEGINLRGVRLDSGDLAAQARLVRGLLDAAGLKEVRIFASGGLDETSLAALAPAPIDGFGIGTSLTTSTDWAALDCAYKLTEYAGTPKRKRSTGKATWPGRKQVFRRYDGNGRMAGDVLTILGDPQDGEPLLVPVLRSGQRVGTLPGLAEARARATEQLARLPEPLRRLEAGWRYPVAVAPALAALAEEADRAVAPR